MPNPPRFFLLLFLLFLPFLAITQISAEQFKKIDEIFEKWDAMDKPGGSLAIVHKGKIVYQKGYGMADLEHAVPNAPNSVFYIGSVSKQFVAMCMLLLKEQGKIDLDADIRTYLPEFPDYGNPITIRNLIHHTSGIRDNLTLWELKGRSHLDDIPEQEIYELICRQKQLNFEPGTAYRYSNSCYFMMSMIVKRVSGQSLREYANEHIFQKLGMKNTFFGDDNRRIVKNRAFGYHENQSSAIENMIMRFDLVGSGGLYSTVEDLYLWDQNFYKNVLGNRKGQALIKEMLTNGHFKDGSEVNYAFALVNGTFGGLKTVSHSGALGGYRAHYLQFPEQQFSVILLGNVTSFQPGDKANAIARICLERQFTSPGRVDQNQVSRKPIPPKVKFLPAQELSHYVGQYYSVELDFSYDIEVVENKLNLKIGETVYPLTPQGDYAFSTENGRTLVFQQDENQKASGFILHTGRVSGLLFERSKDNK